MDPCFGSGSAIFAAKNINRKYIGFEFDSKYFNIVNNIING
jgi:DNA modification methylase